MENLSVARSGWEEPEQVDEFAAFEDAPQAVDEFAAFEDAPEADPFAAFPDADDLDVRSVDDLVADRDTFNPKEFYAANPDVVKDPARRTKLLEVYRQRDKEGLSAAEVAKGAIAEGPSTIGKIFGGLKDLAVGSIKATTQVPFNAVASIFTGDIFDKQRREALFEETKRQQTQAVAESAAASELSASGMADLARQGARKVLSNSNRNPLDLGLVGTPEQTSIITGKAAPEKTDQALLEQLEADLAFGQQLSEVARGGGEAAKAIGLDADTLAKDGIELRPEVMERLSLVDPLTIVGTGGIFSGVTSAGKTVFTAASRAAAQRMIDKLGAAAARAATSPLRAAGGASELAGAAAKKIAPLAPTIGATAGALSGDLSAAGGYFTGKAAQRVLPRLGTALEASGRAAKSAANTVANSTTFQKALVGAAEGSLAAAPFVAAADDDKTAGAILGAGAGLGAGVGAALGAKQGISQRISNRQLAPKDIAYPPTESPGYGINENLDVAHAEAIQSLPQSSQNTINNFRETVRDLGGEVYVLDPEFFEQSLLELAERNKGDSLTGAEADAVRAQATDQGGYFDATLPGPDGQPRRAIFLNNTGNPVAHETGHLFHSLLSPERQADLAATARQVYTPDQIAQFKAAYEEKFGQTISEDRAINELVADNFSQLFQNTPLSELGTPAPLLTKIKSQITGAAESLGLDLTAGARTEMGMTSSLRFNDVLRDTAREIVQPGTRPPTVEPVAPAAPVRAEPMSLTEAAQTLSALPEPTPEIPVVRRVEAAGVERSAPIRPRRSKAAVEEKPTVEPAATPEVPAAAEARTIAAEAPDLPTTAGTKSPRELLGTVAESIANQEGVKINYLSAPDEPAASTTSNRAIRREIIEAFRSMPESARKLWEKTFFPEKIIRTKGGKYQIQGWAPEVFAANAHKFANFLAEVPDAGLLSPYAIDPKTKTFTPEAWTELFNDTQTYVQNQARGATGAGEQLVVPRSVTESGGFAPAVRPGAKPLAQGKADFINNLLGLKLPDTPRVAPGRRPLNIQAQDVSIATKPGRIRKPTVPREKFSGEAAEAMNIAGREILEVNPLRGQFEQAAQQAGVAMPSLIEAIQKLNLENIKEVAGVPEVPQFRANTLTASAGFQPKLPASPAEIVSMAPEAFKELTTAFQGRYGGGLTGLAFEVGAGIGDTRALLDLQSGLIESQNRMMSAKANMDIESMFDQVNKTQFFKEAVEAATGNGGSEAFIQKNFDPSFQSPMKKSLTGSAQFQPADVQAPAGIVNKKTAASAPVIPPSLPSKSDYNKFFDALHQVESGGKSSPPDGDSGRAIGPLQIWKTYWTDAKMPGKYEDVRDLAYARKTVESYMKRYAPDAWKAGDWQTLARIHNGGPKGASKPATTGYWDRVNKQLSKGKK